MEKNTKKILALTILGLFVFVFALQFVSAAEDPLVNSFQTAFSGVTDWFTNAEFSYGLTKFIFLIIVAILVKAVGESMPGLESAFKKDIIGSLLAILISFLAVAYITPEEVISIMTGYSAMGYVLAGLLPFLILLGYTYKLATNSNNGKEINAGEMLGRKLFAYVVWLGFSLFSVYRLIVAMTSGAQYNWLFVLIFPIGGMIMLFSTNTIFKKIRKAYLDEQKILATDIYDKAGTNQKLNAKQLGDLSNKIGSMNNEF